MVSGGQGLRLAVTGGGTGGHVLPALAVIDELQRRGELADLVWIGSRDGVERRAAEDAGIHFIAIPTGKLRRYLSLQNITDATRVPFGVLSARRAIAAFRPDVVLSTGGFVSVPAVVGARGIAPVLTHEQTAILGLANRINARFADVLAVSHNRTELLASRLHRRVVVTGNPIRVGLTAGDRSRGLLHLGFDASLPTLYVTGGARGASPINQRIAALLPGILERVQIVHQTGPLDANPDSANLAQRRELLPEAVRHRYSVVEFIGDELPDVYAAADLVVGRSGAGTIAELAYVGLPAILIPLPGARGDEQSLNAQVLGDAGAAVVIEQPNATPQRLRAEILALLDDPERRMRMADAARSIARPDAAARLADALLSLARQPRFVTRK
ncbi:MAG TPA: undecaprenyldiphospho-muramoylpentapeptide beta-N-acetylglucosaminyltransferase [Thermomicrobiales bacterium]|nr:undecaprenyldiphospho-muramoylpentapeptide beta-N-acetylglucosaminyltransferase [Thermomicrobiales bacterium]